MTFIDQWRTPVEWPWLCRPDAISYNPHFARGIFGQHAHPAGSAAPARLKRGAGVLIAVFWATHFTIMWLRAHLDECAGESGLLEGTLRRIAFALFGVFVSYLSIAACGRFGCASSTGRR